MPDHAVKNPTTFLESKPTNGRFLTKALVKGEPLILLKRGFGYSVVQLYIGKIGEVPTQDMRLKMEGESFDEYYFKSSPRVSTSFRPLSSPAVSRPKKSKETVVTSDFLEESHETFPILNNPFGSVEPELPEW